MSEVKTYSVEEITRQIKLVLEDSFPAIWVEGEVSNYRPHYSGHLYFSLKDENAQISCVMWRSRAETLDFDFTDGARVRVLANIRLYEKSGRYQLDCLRMQPAGIGDLQMRFEELKRRLSEEGLFNQELKKRIPRFPQRIGVITSPTGAAIRDILSVLQRRAPSVQIIVRPAQVQGEGAAPDIARAIAAMNTYGDVDVLIVGRGGGSLEDLWAFNEEVLARAIFASEIPVISAVGHEIDFTIADLVADLRAPTPSAAAELAVPDEFELKAELEGLRSGLVQMMQERIKRARREIEQIKRSYGMRRPVDAVHQFMQRIDEYADRMHKAAGRKIVTQRDMVNALGRQLKQLNPDNVVSRGYAMLFHDGGLVTSKSDVQPESELTAKVKDGLIITRVESTK
jgi:exodeoxyribonuclease VII large subunit